MTLNHMPQCFQPMVFIIFRTPAMNLRKPSGRQPIYKFIHASIPSHRLFSALLFAATLRERKQYTRRYNSWRVSARRFRATSVGEAKLFGLNGDVRFNNMPPNLIITHTVLPPNAVNALEAVTIKDRQSRNIVWELGQVSNSYSKTECTTTLYPRHLRGRQISRHLQELL
jgi:hypothetical protein